MLGVARAEPIAIAAGAAVGRDGRYPRRRAAVMLVVMLVMMRCGRTRITKA